MAEAPTAVQFPAGEGELWSAAVGKNAWYYLPRFARYVQGVAGFPSWNWPAFFVSFWWALYRKAWESAVLFFFLHLLVVVPLLITATLVAPGNGTRRSAAYWIGELLFSVFAAMLANGLYYRRVKALLQTARTRYPDPAEQITYLTAKGGTLVSTAIATGLVVVVIVVGILAGIAVPAYEDYVTRAKVSEVLVAVEPLKRQVELSWNQNRTFPAELDLRDLRTAPGAKYVDSVRFNSDNGRLVVFFGAVDQRLNGKSLLWLPYGQAGQSLSWICYNADAVPSQLLPPVCRK
jgi:hypothetical protein